MNAECRVQSAESTAMVHIARGSALARAKPDPLSILHSALKEGVTDVA
jgi:hypothetical protein